MLVAVVGAGAGDLVVLLLVCAALSESRDGLLFSDVLFSLVVVGSGLIGATAAAGCGEAAASADSRRPTLLTCLSSAAAAAVTVVSFCCDVDAGTLVMRV